MLQLDDCGVWKMRFKFQNVTHFGSPPTVDGLIVIAHYCDVLAGVRQQRDEAQLEAVGVLEFVHHQVVEALLPLKPD